MHVDTQNGLVTDHPASGERKEYFGLHKIEYRIHASSPDLKILYHLRNCLIIEKKPFIMTNFGGREKCYQDDAQ